MPRRKGRLNLREEFTVGKACYVVEFENNELSFHADVLKSGTAAYHMSSFERAFGDDPPDAILAVNEIYAAHALKIATKRGLSIPDDIAIIGFTSGLISEFTTPSLSSVVQHGYLMGRQAAELLIGRIDHTGPNEFQKEVISPNLKIRRSTSR